MIPRYDLGVRIQVIRGLSTHIYGCYNNSRIMGGGGSKNNHCSEMGPKLNLNLYFKKTWHTIGTIEL